MDSVWQYVFHCWICALKAQTFMFVCLSHYNKCNNRNIWLLQSVSNFLFNCYAISKAAWCTLIGWLRLIVVSCFIVLIFYLTPNLIYTHLQIHWYSECTAVPQCDAIINWGRDDLLYLLMHTTTKCIWHDSFLLHKLVTWWCVVSLWHI